MKFHLARFSLTLSDLRQTDNTGNSKSLLYKNLNFNHKESVFITKYVNLR